MNHFPYQPLSEEERELARLTGRLGPNGEPSPALDARILATAHASVATAPARRRSARWPAAMGVAASLMLAVGVAWQLRPLQETVVHSEAPVAAAEVAQVPGPDTAAAATDQAPAPLAEVQAPPAIPSPSQSQSRQSAKPAAAPKVVPASPAPQTVAPARPVDAVPPTPRPMDVYAPPPPAAPAPRPQADPAPAMDSARAFPAEDEVLSAESNSSTGGATRARQPESAKAQAQTEAEAKQRSPALEVRGVDQVEVTGSRLQRTDLQVPVSDDAELPAAQWLERIRTRYGLGDIEAARQSLQGFIREYPRQPIPDDLAPLLEP